MKFENYADAHEEGIGYALERMIENHTLQLVMLFVRTTNIRNDIRELKKDHNAILVQFTSYGHVPQGKRFCSADGRRKSAGILTRYRCITRRVVHAQNGGIFWLWLSPDDNKIVLNVRCVVRHARHSESSLMCNMTKCSGFVQTIEFSFQWNFHLDMTFCNCKMCLVRSSFWWENLLIRLVSFEVIETFEVIERWKLIDHHVCIHAAFQVDCVAFAHIGYSYYIMPNARWVDDIPRGKEYGYYRTHIHDLLESKELSAMKAFIERTKNTLFGDDFKNNKWKIPILFVP